MSLEQTLEQTNDLLKQIITILQTGVSAGAEIGVQPEATTKRSAGRPKKEVAAGTTYWHIPSHNSVFAQEPGMAAPTMPDAVKISAEDYAAKKAVQMAATQAVIASHTHATTTSAQPEVSPADSKPTAEVAAGAAAQSSTAQPAPQPSTAQTAAAGSAGDVPYAEVLAKFKELNAAAGHGRESVMAVLKKFLPNEAAPTVSKIEALGRNAEVLAEISALLAPAADFDPLA